MLIARRDGHTDPMDPCATRTAWSIFTATAPYSTLAGVLTGFLIVAIIGLFVTFSRLSFHIIALFSAGVPGLALSSFLFGAVAGATAPPNTTAADAFCAQTWSQGMVAIGMLAVGGAVLVCGLGWALVSYGDAYTIKTKTTAPIASANKRLELSVQMGGWLSVAILVATIALLTAANLVYLKSTQLTNQWYVLIIATYGLYCIFRSADVAIRRTSSALGEVPGHITSSRIRNSNIRFLVITMEILIGSLLALHLADLNLRWSIGAILLYPALWAYHFYRPPNIIESTDKSEQNALEAETDSCFEGKVSLDRMLHTSFNLVALAIAGTLFAALLTQMPLWTGARIGLTFFFGGIYPIAILAGLSYTVPAAREFPLPNWKKSGFLRYIP